MAKAASRPKRMIASSAAKGRVGMLSVGCVPAVVALLISCVCPLFTASVETLREVRNCSHALSFSILALFWATMMGFTVGFGLGVAAGGGAMPRYLYIRAMTLPAHKG